MKAFVVSHKVTITYSRVVIAVDKADAEATARDLGDFGADDRAIETDWKAKRVKKGEGNV